MLCEGTVFEGEIESQLILINKIQHLEVILQEIVESIDQVKRYKGSKEITLGIGILLEDRGFQNIFP